MFNMSIVAGTAQIHGKELPYGYHFPAHDEKRDGNTGMKRLRHERNSGSLPTGYYLP